MVIWIISHLSSLSIYSWLVTIRYWHCSLLKATWWPGVTNIHIIRSVCNSCLIGNCTTSLYFNIKEFSYIYQVYLVWIFISVCVGIQEIELKNNTNLSTINTCIHFIKYNLIYICNNVKCNFFVPWLIFQCRYIITLNSSDSSIFLIS